ncbi:MAG: tyrosine-type recombinase/integrase [Candidatus Binatia bacterium]
MWWLSYYTKRGQHVCESAKTKDKKEARDLLKVKMGQLQEGRLVIGADRVTFEDLIAGVEADYITNDRKSLDKVKSRARHLAKSFAGCKATEIGRTEIKAFIVRRKREGASNGEINRELDVLRRGFNLALEDEKLTRAPKVPRLEESSPRAGFFEPAEFEVATRHLPAYLQPPMTFAYLTGWRCRSEVLPLPWRNVDFEAETIRLDVGSTKNKDGRVIYMTPELLALLEEQRRTTLALQRETQQLIPLVFHHNGRPIVNYYKAWHRACRAAGLSAKIPHDFRRTAVRNMVRAGILEKVAMQMAGHKTRSVFDRYHIVVESDLKEAARKLAAVMPFSTATFSATVHPLAPSENPLSVRNS